MVNFRSPILLVVQDLYVCCLYPPFLGIEIVGAAAQIICKA